MMLPATIRPSEGERERQRIMMITSPSRERGAFVGVAQVSVVPRETWIYVACWEKVSNSISRF